ncbi:folliculin-interacting protein 2 [Periplaneta americana]|uniref:folliculin-interacting protein 2 n=1 Tax=Periplaneta americana TaxID=6978 RepID=UPI0037E7B716
MALLNRLFPSRKKSHKQGYVPFGRNETESWKPFNFSKEQVRVLLFRECDWRGRKLLFDSNAVQKVSLENQPCSKLKFGSRQKSENKKTDAFVEVTNGYGYQYMRPNSDVTVLGEMIFGSVAMAFQGTVFKVHSMKSPSRLMCTKVFHSPVTGSRSRGVSDRSLEDSCGSSINSMSDYFTSQGSCPDTRQGSIGSGPLDIELRTKHHYSSLEVDSGFCGDASLQSTSSVGSGGCSSGWLGTYTSSPDSRRSSGSFLTNPLPNHSGSSLASLQRRWRRNMSTSLELGSQGSPWSSRSTVNDPNEDPALHSHRRTKLGLAVVISVTQEEEKDMHTFFFEHMTIMEGIMERLHSSVEHAYLHKEMFVHFMMEGYQDMQRWLVDIFSAPRLTCPVWLGLTSGFSHLNSALSYNFIQDLCQLIATIDTKATNFFISTLVTAVLTHHLGWVATILPGKVPPHHISKNPCTGQLLDALSKSHPYNPLWAQLGELYGALGFPTKIAKTIVTTNTKKLELINKILSSLTYFIRCTEVEKRVVEKQDSSKEERSELNTSASWESNSASKTTLVNEELHSTPSQLARNFLSGRDVMIVFDNRVDPGVEIARELKGEISAFPDTHSVAEQRSSPETTVHNKGGFHSNSSSSEQKCVLPDKSRIKNESDKNVKSDSYLSLPSGGGMKRNISFAKKLDSASTVTKLEKTSSTSSQGSNRLYPSLADFKLLEDDIRDSGILLQNEDSNVEDVQVNEDNRKLQSSFHHEEISQKVSRLCRVPTSAILYHLRNENTEKDVQFKEMHVPKRIENERQRSSVKTAPVIKVNNWPEAPVRDTKHASSTSNIASQGPNSDRKEIASETSKGDVIFVIGDNEQLVDLKQSHKSDNKNNEKSISCENDISGCDECNGYQPVTTTSSLPSTPAAVCDKDGRLSTYASQAFHSNVKMSHLGSNNCLCDVKPSVCVTNSDSAIKSESNMRLSACKAEGLDVPTEGKRNAPCSTFEKKVVTVRPSVIELEDECGGLRTDLTANHKVRTIKPVTRSLSLSCPLSGDRNGLPICRRNSDCVCEASRYLKDYHSVRFHFERCESVLMNYIEGRDQKKTLNKSDQKVDKVTEARGNFCLVESSVVCEKCNSVAKDAFSIVDRSDEKCDTRGEIVGGCVSIKNNGASDGEKNAIFESYNSLSDDEALCDDQKVGEETVPEEQKQQQFECLLQIPTPRCRVDKNGKQLCGFAASLLGGASDHYIPDMVLQGCMQLPKGWETSLRRDLSLTAHNPLLDQEVAEAVCIVADIDTWEVQLVSSHTYVVDKPGTLGIRVGMSRLVANMLESLLYLWKLKASPEHCLLHLESKLRELFLRSQALAELLLTTEFCDMELLTTSLDLDANDVPLLLAIASTHSPQVTERYGLSFR